MNYDEEFDRIIRQKAEEQEYAFEEGHWNKASKLIDEDRAASRRAAFKNLYFPGAMILMMTGLSFWMISFFRESNAAIERDPVLAIHTPEGALQKIQAVAKQEALNSFAKKQTATERSSAAPAQARQNLLTQARQRSSAAVLSPAQSSQVPAQASAFKSPAEPNNTAPVEAGLNAGVADNQEIEMPPGANAEEQMLSPGRASAADETAMLLQPVTALLKFEREAGPGLRGAALVHLERYDEDYFKARQRKTHFLDAEAGAFYGLGWQTGSGWDGKGLNWFGGFNYGRYIGDNTAVSAGLQYYQVNNISRPFFNQIKTSYGFGAVESGSTITSERLHYIALPIRVDYALGTGSRISAGINTGFLFRSDNSVQSYTMLDNVRTNTGLSRDKYVYDDQRRMNLTLTAGYKVNLHRRIRANAEFMYGLTDVFINNRMVKNPEKTTGFRLSLQYLIVDK